MKYFKNLDVIAPFLSTTHYEFLKRRETCEVQIVRHPETHHHNLIVSGQTFYSPDVETIVNQQIRTHLDHPIFVNFGRFFDYTPFMSLYVLENTKSTDFFQTQLRSEEGSDWIMSKKSSPGFCNAFCVIIGIGTALHIEQLAETTKSKNLIICDYYLDFLQASLEHANWPKIVDVIKSRGGKIKFIIGHDPNLVSAAAAETMRKMDNGMLPGSYFFNHYDLDPKQTLARKISLNFEQVRNYNGWMEDELIHIQNITANLNEYSRASTTKPKKFIVSDHSHKTSHEKPIIIVGSGPSAKEFIPLLKKRRDRITIFSGGSSLKPLMEAGIHPDIHTELENVAAVNDLLSCITDQASLRKIPLFASITVDPNIKGFFDKCFFFMREGEVITKLLRKKLKPLPNSGGTAINSAMALALYANPPAIFLIGVDFAYSDSGEHHLSNVGYNSKKWIEKHSNFNTEQDALMVPGNNGSSLKTTSVWRHMCIVTEQLITHHAPSLPLYNCGSGAEIKGTKPLISQQDFEMTLLSLSRQSTHDYGNNEFLSNFTIHELDSSYLSTTTTSLLQVVEYLNDFANQFQGVLDKIREMMSSNTSASDADNLMQQTFEKVFELLDAYIESEMPAKESAGHFVYEDIRKSLHIMRQLFILAIPEQKLNILQNGVGLLEVNILRGIARFIASTKTLLKFDKIDLNPPAGNPMLNVMEAWWQAIKENNTDKIKQAFRTLISHNHYSYWLLEESIMWSFLKSAEDKKSLYALFNIIHEFELPQYHQACPYCEAEEIITNKMYEIPSFTFLVTYCKICTKEFFARKYLPPSYINYKISHRISDEKRFPWFQKLRKEHLRRETPLLREEDYDLLD